MNSFQDFLRMAALPLLICQNNSFKVFIKKKGSFLCIQNLASGWVNLFLVIALLLE